MTAASMDLMLRFQAPLLEQEWRERAFNRLFLTGDTVWTISLMIWALSLIMRWQNPGVVGYSWLAIQALLSAGTLAYQRRYKKSYERNRIPTLIFLRLIRLVLVHTVVAPASDSIWAPPTQVFCPTTVISSQYSKIAYVFCQAIAYQLPLVHQIWMIPLSAATAAHSGMATCFSFCGKVSELGECAKATVVKLGALSRLWVFSANFGNDKRGEMEPWKACATVYIVFLVFVGAIVPLLVCATLEENWRQNWLLWRGGWPCLNSLPFRLIFDVAFSLIALVALHEAIHLIILYI